MSVSGMYTGVIRALVSRRYSESDATESDRIVLRMCEELRSENIEGHAVVCGK